MAGKLTFTLEQYQDAARKFKKELLMLPILGSKDTLQFMTGRPGIRYKETVGTADYSAQFGPYNPSRRSNENLKLDFRTLETFLGSVVSDFEPNSAISTLLGQGATKGDGQMQTPTAKLVLALMAKSLSYNLNNAIWGATRNPNGSTTMDLFDGFDTITSKEIVAETISASKGNYLKLTDQITKQNCCDVLKDILFHLDPHLRAQNLYAYCSQEIVDMYNESYQLSHGGLPYNTKYVQNAVEGSDGRLILVPLANKSNSKFIHITTKANMLYGYDNMGDETSINVKEFSPFMLSLLPRCSLVFSLKPLINAASKSLSLQTKRLLLKVERVATTNPKTVAMVVVQVLVREAATVAITTPKMVVTITPKTLPKNKQRNSAGTTPCRAA